MDLADAKKVRLAKLLPELSLTTFYRMWRDGKTHELVRYVQTLYENSLAESGVEDPAASPVTLSDVLNLLQLLGWFAPSSEFLPPPGQPNANYSRFVFLDPGESERICFCANANESTKLKNLAIEPENLTAMEAVQFALRFTDGARANPSYLHASAAFGAIEQCDETLGSFSVMENITIPPKTTLCLDFTNLDQNSEAIVHVTARYWRTL